MRKLEKILLIITLTVGLGATIIMVAYPKLLELASESSYCMPILKDFVPVIIGNMFFGVIIMIGGTLLDNKIKIQSNIPHLDFGNQNVSAQFEDKKGGYRDLTFTVEFNENLKVFFEHDKRITNGEILSLQYRKPTKISFTIFRNESLAVVQTYKVTVNRKLEPHIKLIETIYR